MDQSDEPRDIKRKLAQADRVASLVSDQTTRSRLSGWIAELKQMLRRHSEGQLTRKQLGDELNSFGSSKASLPAAIWSSG